MRFLIADDSSVSSWLLARLLEPYGDCETCTSGREVFERFCAAKEADVPYDLILLDLLLPEIDGNAALCLIRDYEETQGIVGAEATKVVVVTASTDTQRLFETACCGAELFIVKPVDREKLLKGLLGLGVIDHIKPQEDTMH